MIVLHGLELAFGIDVHRLRRLLEGGRGVDHVHDRALGSFLCRRDGLRIGVQELDRSVDLGRACRQVNARTTIKRYCSTIIFVSSLILKGFRAVYCV